MCTRSLATECRMQAEAGCCSYSYRAARAVKFCDSRCNSGAGPPLEQRVPTVVPSGEGPPFAAPWHEQ